MKKMKSNKNRNSEKGVQKTIKAIYAYSRKTLIIVNVSDSSTSINNKFTENYHVISYQHKSTDCCAVDPPWLNVYHQWYRPVVLKMFKDDRFT